MDVVTRVGLECSYGAGDGRTRSGVASMPKERSGRPGLDQSCDWEKYGYDTFTQYSWTLGKRRPENNAHGQIPLPETRHINHEGHTKQWAVQELWHHKNSHSTGTMTRWHPFELLVGDYLSMPTGKGGYHTLGLYLDTFSQHLWVMKFKMEGTAKTMVDSLSTIFNAYTAMEAFMSDGGKHFDNTMVKEFCAKWSCTHHVVAAYSP